MLTDQRIPNRIQGSQLCSEHHTDDESLIAESCNEQIQ